MENKTNKTIGKTICIIRKNKGLSQEDLAVSFNNHREFISRIERGLVDIRISSLEKIADALDVDINDLICNR